MLNRRLLFRLSPLAIAIQLSVSLFSQEANTLPAAVNKALVTKYGADNTRYLSNFIDLNGDGKPEVIVHIVSPMECGSGGCPTLVFSPTPSGYRLVSTISVTRTPVRISPRSSNGWRNLIVAIAGGGAKNANAELAFNGRSYASNPTVAPAKKVADVSDSAVLIPDFDSFESAKELKAASPATKAGGPAGPSFDCAKATQAAEKLICSDAELASLDRTLAGAYQAGIQRWTADGIADGERAAQRQWMAERNKCGNSRDCVEASYKRRIVEVQIRSGQLEAPKPVTFSCTGNHASPLQAAFYNGTDPQSAVLTLGSEQVIAFAARAASGAKYTAPEVEFWEHQGEATVQWFGKTLKCRPLKR